MKSTSEAVSGSGSQKLAKQPYETPVAEEMAIGSVVLGAAGSNADSVVTFSNPNQP